MFSFSLALLLSTGWKREDGDLTHSGRIGSREDSTYSELLGNMCNFSLYDIHCNLVLYP